MAEKRYPVAQLPKEVLDKLQGYERNLKKETEEDIVLIAYQKERS